MSGGNTTDNTSALIRAQVYSQIILDIIENTQYLPDGIYRDVSDFPDGTTLNIPTMGDIVLRDIDEDEPRQVDPLDTGSITLTIDKFKGAGSYLTDKFKEDSYLAAQFESAMVPKQLKAIRKSFETDMLATANAQTASDPNDINGLAHRYVASGTNQVIDIADIIYAKLALDKAEIDDDSRIGIVDGLLEATLNTSTNLVNLSNNREFQGIVETGFAKNRRFLKHVFGFDIYVSNRLPEVNSETVDTSSITVPAPSSSATVTSGVANIFMYVGDEMSMPFMGAWRRKPRVTAEREEKYERDTFYTSARWGFGLQRPQSLVVILTSRVAY